MKQDEAATMHDADDNENDNEMITKTHETYQVALLSWKLHQQQAALTNLQ